MFAIGIPFLVVYAGNPRQWWSLIPGGILAVIGVSLLVAEVALEYILPAVLLIAGIWIVARQLLRGEQADPAVTLPHGNRLLLPNRTQRRLTAHRMPMRPNQGEAIAFHFGALTESAGARALLSGRRDNPVGDPGAATAEE